VYRVRVSCTLRGVPKLWTETIEAHRSQVREVVLETTAGLAAEHGLRAVTMSQIAEKSGIARATLYKYFPDVETILVAWHEGQVLAHIKHLVTLRDQADGPFDALQAVLSAYALICYDVTRRDQGTELTALLHRNERVAAPEQQLHELVRDLIAQTAENREIRGDVNADELAAYCLSALAGAGRMRSKAAVQRLVAVTITGLQPR
jgi:AcrR family transcriptional regulator